MQNYNSKFKTNLNDRCFQLSLRIISLSEQFPKKRSAWVINDQVLRSICSIGANLIEAKASSSRLEFKKYNEIALKSANESKYWLELLKESGLLKNSQVDPLLNELNEISSMIASGIIKLKQKI
jgi:four helix bundle protein